MTTGMGFRVIDIRFRRRRDWHGRKYGWPRLMVPTGYRALNGARIWERIGF